MVGSQGSWKNLKQAWKYQIGLFVHPSQPAFLGLIYLFAPRILYRWHCLCIMQPHTVAAVDPCKRCKHRYFYLFYTLDASFSYAMPLRSRRSLSSKSEYPFLDFIIVPFYSYEYTMYSQQYYQNHHCPLCQPIQLLILIYFSEHPPFSLPLRHHTWLPLSLRFLLDTLPSHLFYNLVHCSNDVSCHWFPILSNGPDL